MAGALHEHGRDSADPLLAFVATTPLPVAMVDVAPGGAVRVAAASGPLRHPLAGLRYDDEHLAEVLVGPPSDGIALFRDPGIRAYERRVEIAEPGREPLSLQCWVRAVDREPPIRRVLVLCTPYAEEEPVPPMPTVGPMDGVQVVGSTDQRLVVDRISSDVEALTGSPADDVIGRHLIELTCDEDVGVLLIALGRVASTGRGASVQVRLRSTTGTRCCECVLVPLRPTPSVAFALSEVQAVELRSRTAEPVHAMVERLHRNVNAAATAHRLKRSFEGSSELSKLSTRELEIVRRLVDGDRVPAIAKAMFLSQSTVRSHLSAAFAKLGVSSQQQMISKLRAGRTAHNVQ